MKQSDDTHLLKVGNFIALKDSLVAIQLLFWKLNEQ